MFNLQIPPEVEELLNKIKKFRYKSYIIGQGVVDLLLGKEPTIWKVATDASFQEIVQIFPQTFFTATKENHITVVVWQRPIEVVSLSSSLKEYLSLSSFSLEAIAYEWEEVKLLDYFSALNSIDKKIITTLLPVEKLFRQYPLEMLRAIRLGAQYEFSICNELIQVIKVLHPLLEQVPLDKIRDELALILLAPKPSPYLEILAKALIIKLFLPELDEALNYQISKGNDLGEHLFATVDYLPVNLELRLAGIFHDLGKTTLKPVLRGQEFIYPGHEEISAQIAKKILNRFNFFTKVVGHNVNHHKIISLIRNHMFSYNPFTTTDKGIQRLIARVGIENIEDLLVLREANILAGSQAKQSKMSLYYSLKKRLNTFLKHYN